MTAERLILGSILVKICLCYGLCAFLSTILAMCADHREFLMR